jgi:CRISPR/Cas system CSM-associated protein Csm3 (group 7 of RAMP superfamily)
MENVRYYRGIAPVQKKATAPEEDRTHLRYTAGRLTGKIRAELVALQPLHVGSGILVPPDALGLDAPDVPLVKAWMRKRGIDGPGAPFIPGSSLKGVFRSLVELLTEACVCKTKDREWGRSECRYDSKQHRGQLCPACKIFGAMGYQGQVRFTDATMLEGQTALHFLPPQYQPRIDQHNPRRRYYPHSLVDPRTDQNWPMEVITPGGRFAFEGQFTNLSAAELGLLLIVLGQGNWALCPKVGAGKSCGLGAVRIENLVAEQVDLRRAYTTLDTTAAWKPVDGPACLAAAMSLARSTALETLARDLQIGEASHG